MNFQRQILVLATALFGHLPTPATADCADLALVLAIDASGSVDEGEYMLQMEGYARALASVDVVAAIDSVGRVEAAAIVWGDADYPVHQTEWVRLDIHEARSRFAEDLVTTQRSVTGSTGLASALQSSLDLLETRPECDGRRIINVSGDGRNSVSKTHSPTVSLSKMKARALREGITVNALAIQTSEPVLGDYFKRELIVGGSAFVMVVSDFQSFQNAIREKLAREIRLPQVASIGGEYSACDQRHGPRCHTPR